VTGPAPGGVRHWLVAGSYPPVPGAPAAAAVAAVRRAWAGGAEVTVASPRPSAAAHLLSGRGRALGRELGALARREACDGAVVCVEPGWPFTGRGRPEPTARALAAAVSGLAAVEVVITGPVTALEEEIRALAPLCAPARVVTASSEPLAAAVAGRIPGVEVRVVDPFAGAGLRPPASPGTVPAVGPLEPGALLVAARGRRLASRAARTVLGRRTPAVRAALQRLLRSG
jgi:hypothetical protein